MATDRVSIGQMADAIMEGLEEYASLATDDLKASVRKAGKTAKDEIAATAPKDTGKYAKSWAVKTQKETSNSLELALIPESFRTDIRKETLDSKGVLIENSEMELAAFALLFEFDGDQKHIRHVLYNCSASRPGIEGKTNEDSKEVQTEKLSLKAVPLANGMVKAKTGNTTDATTYSDWYKAVYVPAAESDVATQSAAKPAKAVKE